MITTNFLDTLLERDASAQAVIEDRRHPMGLAVMLRRDGKDSEQAQRAAKKYWEDLNLRIVQFSAPKGDLMSEEEHRWEGRFIRFFELTKRIEYRKELEKSYRVAARQEEIAEAFHANVEVMHSAFDDNALEHVWMRSSEERSRFWIAALNKALPKISHESATNSAQAFNLEQGRQSTSDGTKAPPHKQVSELRQSAWDPSGSARQDHRFDPAWKLLEAQQGRELLWKIDGLLRCGVERAALARWLRLVVERPDILDAPSVDSRTLMCGFLFVTSWDESHVKLVRERASSRFSHLVEVLGTPESASVVDPPLVALLKQARHGIEIGNLELAHVSYAQAIEGTAACSEPDAPLLSYFALRGYADTITTPSFSPEEFERLGDAREKSRMAREQPFVRQWLDRVERFKSALAKSRSERLEQELVRGSYETRSVSFSNSGWQLDVIRQDAVQRGAPLSLERELTMSLLGAYESEYGELEERLRLGIDKTGQWLSRQMTSGDMFRRRSRAFFADRLQAGASERTEGVQELSKLLFPSASSQTVVRRRAMIEVLKSTSRILRQDDVPLAIAEIARIREDDASFLSGEVLASLAHVCKWDDVKDQIMSALDELSVRDFRVSAEKFPWEHWLTCDDFLARGGGAYLECLLTGSVSFERTSVGWALAMALAAAPEDPRLVELCGRYASTAREHEEQDSAREQIANFAVCSRAFVDKNPAVENRLRELLDQGDRAVARILAGSLPDSDWADRARAALENAVWSGLPQLAPILTRARWSPGDWKELQTILRLGGHRGKLGSWVLGRLDLTIDALGRESSRGSLFDDSPDGLGFLRHSLVDALGSGDGILANRAVYGFTSLAEHVRSDSDAESISTADTARKVAENLQDDPLAIVKRQAVFGAAKGRQTLGQMRQASREAV